MLLPSSRTAPRLSRPAAVGIVAAGVLACLLPTLGHAPIQTEPQQVQANAQARSRICVNGEFRYKPKGKDQDETHFMIVAIDPASGKWQKITDEGYCGRVSPDRQTLVFGRGNQIWNCDTGGTNHPARIADISGRPIYSPDGKYVVATKGKLVGGRWKDETWRMDVDGSNPTRLPIPDSDAVEDWSPDGQWLVTCSDRHPPHGSGYQLFIMKTDGSQERRLTHGGLNCYARFSPDGRKILYLQQMGKKGNSIWVVDVDSGNAREIVEEVDLVAPDGACWSPDGKQVAVMLSNWELNEKGKRVGKNENPRIEIMDADGGNRRELKLVDAKFESIGALGDWRYW